MQTNTNLEKIDQIRTKLEEARANVRKSISLKVGDCLNKLLNKNYPVTILDCEKFSTIINNELKGIFHNRYWAITPVQWRTVMVDNLLATEFTPTFQPFVHSQIIEIRQKREDSRIEKRQYTTDEVTRAIEELFDDDLGEFAIFEDDKHYDQIVGELKRIFNLQEWSTPPVSYEDISEEGVGGTLFKRI